MIEIPEGWSLVPIVELRNKNDRYSFTGGPFGSDLKSEHYTIDGVRIIQLQNIGEGKFLNESKVFTSKEKADKLISCNAYPGEIILAKMAPVGRSCKLPRISDRYLMCSDGIRLSVDRDKYDNEFVFQALNSKYFRDEVESKSTGTTRARIGLSELKVINIAVPRSKVEQQKIAEILSTVDEKIEVIDQQIQQTKQLKKGLMQRLLTKGIGHTKFKDSVLGEIPESWEVVKLGELLEKIVGGGTPSREKPDYWNGDIPWATVKDLKKSVLNDTEEFITAAGLKDSASNLIPKGTLIIATRMALGKAVFFTKDVSINQDLKALFTKSILSKGFLFFWFSLNSTAIEDHGSGSTVKGIRLEVLRNFNVALPTIKEQESIAEILFCYEEKLCVLAEKKLHYQTLKKGLMQKLLTGKIRVNHLIEKEVQL